MQFDIYSGNQGGQLLARGLGLCKIIRNHFKNIFHKNLESEMCEILRICAGDKSRPLSQSAGCSCVCVACM